MASLALQLVGSAIGGPIGGLVGGFIGGLIDNTLFPAKSPPPPKITSSTYGQAIPLLYGPTTRVGCNLIWTSGWRKVSGKSAKLASKKGVPPAYECDVAFGVFDASSGLAAQDQWLTKLFANGSVIFDATDATSTPTPDANGVVTWTLTNKSHKNFDSIVTYPGNFTQTPDPTIEAALGVGNTPAFRGTGYFVINGLQGTPFGNSVPVLNALCATQSSITLAEVVLDICDRCGLITREVSTSSLTSDVGGYAITSQTDGVQALQPLALCYDFDLAETAGSLRFFPRGEPSLTAITNDQLAGHVPSGQRPQFQWPRAPDVELPRMAALTFVDAARDGNTNTQSAMRETGSSQSNLSTNVEVTLTSAEARAVCDRMLWEAHLARQTLQAESDDRLIFLESGRNFDVEVPGDDLFEQVRITKRTRGANGVIQFEAKRDYPSIYGSSAPAANGAIAANGLNIGGPVNPPIFVEPPSTFLSPATLLIGLSGGDGATADPAWSGCTVYVSTDDVTGDYTVAGVQLGPSCMGKLTATLAAHGGGNPDTTSTLAVSTAMSGADPQAQSATDASKGLVPYYVGGEILSAETVTDLGGESFDLTNLYRHLYGTSGGSHASGAAFLRLDAAAFHYPLPKAYIGQVLYFRFVGTGEDLSTATTYSFTPGGGGFGTASGGAPATASAPTVTPSSGGNVVSITPNIAEDNVTQFQVLRADGAGAAIGSATVIATIAGGTQTFTDATAIPGQAYTYFVVPVNAIGAGTGSAGVDATTAPIGAPRTIQASADLAAGAFVNIWSSSGAIRVRPADATDDSKPADGFVLAPVTSGDPATVYGLGAQNTQLSGLTPGTEYFLDTSGAGGVTSPAPSSGLQQSLGKADSATALIFTPQIIGMGA